MDETIEINIGKSLHENASEYYENAKRSRAKAKRIEELIHKGVHISERKEEKKKEQKRKWYEQYRWFISKTGFIVITGRNANQNERIYKNIIKDDDLFLHAEIVGAAFTVVKKGVNADEETLNAAAQFAVSYSRAWKFGYAAADAYAVKKEQLTKKTSGMYVKKGAVIITGKKRWFNNVPLGLAIGYYKNKLACFPQMCKNLLTTPVSITPGSTPKEEIAKVIAEKINAKIDDIMKMLPAGETSIIE